MAKTGARARTRARRSAVQALYQWQATGQNIGDIEAQFIENEHYSSLDGKYFHELLHGIPGHLSELDRDLNPILDRPLDKVDPVERAILRLGAYELSHHPEIPWRVILNESVELAKMFGAEKGHRFINGILDKLAHRLRSVEISASGAN